MILDGPGYRVALADDGLTAELGPLRLRPLAALDTVGAVDETLAVEPPRLLAPGVAEVRRRSTVWDEAVVRLVCADDGLEVHTTVRGRGRLDTVRLLAGRSLLPGRPNGLLPSGVAPSPLFTPSPDDPELLLHSSAETVSIGVVGDSEPGRGHWFFTPAPLYLVLGDVGLSLVGPVEGGPGAGGG